MTIVATDDGFPPKTATIYVIINVQKNQFSPEFVGTPYIRTISENTKSGSSVYQNITVRDRDLAGQIRYRLVGDGIAPAFFRIDERTGVIYLRDGVNLKTDRTLNYTVSVSLSSNITSKIIHIFNNELFFFS